jgi:hypothetical protein
MRSRRSALWTLAALTIAGCSSFDPSDVDLTGSWSAPNAYSGCSLSLTLEDNAGVVAGTAVSQCPSPGPDSSPVTGTRAGEDVSLTFEAGPGDADHTGKIRSASRMRLRLLLPDEPLDVDFTRSSANASETE